MNARGVAKSTAHEHVEKLVNQKLIEFDKVGKSKVIELPKPAFLPA
jgi:uncharacterized membrane protein